jgi:hypothetical protein
VIDELDCAPIDAGVSASTCPTEPSKFSTHSPCHHQVCSGQTAQSGDVPTTLFKEKTMHTNQYLIAELARLRGEDAFRAALSASSLRLVDRPEVRERLLRRHRPS